MWRISLTISARIQTHQAKILSAINKQTITAKEKQAQIDLMEAMALNNLITGLEPKRSQIIRPIVPGNILTVICRIKRKFKLHNLKTQKFNNNRSVTPPISKTNPYPFSQQCSFCKRTVHLFNQCVMRIRQTQSNGNSSQNFSNYRPISSIQTQYQPHNVQR